MSSSAAFGKIYITLLAMKLQDAGALHSIVDCGCGEGTYPKWLGGHLKGVRWTGVEIWEPYVEKFDLRSKYDRLFVEDARRFDFASAAPADLVIFGDMIEHMTKEEAVGVIARAAAVAPFVVISIPVVHYPQGPEGGNPYEAHVKDDWSHYEVMQTFPGISAFMIHGFIGVYVLTNGQHATELVQGMQDEVGRLTREQLPTESMAWGGWQVRNHLG